MNCTTLLLATTFGLAFLTLLPLTTPSSEAKDKLVLLPKDAKLEKVWTGGKFVEGPAQGALGEIYFTDIPNKRIMRHSSDGTTKVFREDSGRANGLIFDAKGRLIACEGGAEGGRRQVARYEHDGTVTVLATHWNGKRLNSPNDITLDSKGRIYFSDPRYGSQDDRELDHQSVYRIDGPKKVTRIIDDVKKPNGLAISPNDKFLYVSDTDARKLYAYPLKSDGAVGERKMLYDFGEDRSIDGMEVDTKGLIWAAAGRGETAAINVISPYGDLIQKIKVPEFITNCCFAGPGGKTLFITSGTSLYKIQTNHKGFRRYPK